MLYTGWVHTHSFGSTAIGWVHTHSFGSTAIGWVHTHSFGSTAIGWVHTHSFGSTAIGWVHTHSFGSTAIATQYFDIILYIVRCKIMHQFQPQYDSSNTTLLFHLVTFTLQTPSFLLHLPLTSFPTRPHTYQRQGQAKSCAEYCAKLQTRWVCKPCLLLKMLSSHDHLINALSTLLQ